ncbi:hypothetical protein FQN60_015700, partial [Etheostoma spectabile]
MGTHPSSFLQWKTARAEPELHLFRTNPPHERDGSYSRSFDPPTEEDKKTLKLLPSSSLGSSLASLLRRSEMSEDEVSEVVPGSKLQICCLTQMPVKRSKKSTCRCERKSWEADSSINTEYLCAVFNVAAQNKPK